MAFASKAQQRWAFSKDGLDKDKPKLSEHFPDLKKKARMMSLSKLAGLS